MKLFKIYRLCRDEKTISRLKEEERKYNLPESKYLTHMDLYSFVNEVIDQEEADYALLCHDDVVLPEDIAEKVQSSINSANLAFGSNNWSVLGNAGVEIISKRTVTYLSDPHTDMLPPTTTSPHIVESVDGNTILLNLRNIRKKHIRMPRNLKGFHLYDLILCMESYKKDLICGVTSKLYVTHKSPGNYEGFVEGGQNNKFQKYFRESFTNHFITTINGLIDVKRNYNYLSEPSKLKSYEDTILETVRRIHEEKALELNILIRIHKKSNKIYRLLNSIAIFNTKTSKNLKLNIFFGVNNIKKENIEEYLEEIKKEYQHLNINIRYIKLSGSQYPRVETLTRLLDELKRKDNSYVWIVDYDDYIMPESAKYFPFLLVNQDLVVGDSYTFTEKWGREKYPITSVLEEKHCAHNVRDILSGKNFIPICSVIYPTNVIKKIFKKMSLRGDYFEDYAILLSSIKQNIRWYPIPLAGISYHGNNTVLQTDRTHWEYSYSTFLSEIVNKKTVPTAFYEFRRTLESPELAEFQSFKQGFIWKTLNKYRAIRKKLRDILND
jgi:hypothetical protein